MNRIQQSNYGTRSYSYPQNSIPYMPETPTVAMAYVPMQQFDANVYAPTKALERGTLFPQLDLPFEGLRTGGYRRG